MPTKLQISNVTCWEKNEDWEKLFNNITQQGGCLVFWLGCSFPYDFCEKLKMPICGMPLGEFKEYYKKYKL